jgi:hypothetical protein
MEAAMNLLVIGTRDAMALPAIRPSQKQVSQQLLFIQSNPT